MKKPTQYSDIRAEAVKKMEGVVNMPSGSPKRWRAAYDIFLKVRPEARPIADEVAAWVREQRRHQDKFASSKNSRMAYGTPPFLMQLLKNTDPEYFNSRNPADYKEVRHLKLMKKAFPEFFYAEVI